MKYTIALALISSLFITTAHAQVHYGIRNGVNFSRWQGQDIQIVEDIVDKTDGYVNTKGITGLNIGGYVNIPIAAGVSIEPGLQYSRKGYAMRGDFKIDALKYLGVDIGARVQSHYIDMPLLLRINAVKGFNIFAGPQISYLVRSTLNAKLGILGISLFNKGFGITNHFNRVDMGAVGGMAYQFESGINVQAGYEYGLTKLNKNDTYDAHNSVVKLSLGYTF